MTQATCKIGLRAKFRSGSFQLLFLALSPVFAPLFSIGFFGALVATVFFLAVKSCEYFFADRTFLFHSNHISIE